MNVSNRILYTGLMIAAIGLSACGAAPAPAAVIEPAAEEQAAAPVVPEPTAVRGELFFARPEGQKGHLIAYDMLTGGAAFELPAGIASADQQTFFTAEPAGEATILGTYKLDTGQRAKDHSVEGKWALAAVAPNGRWVALTRVPAEAETQAWQQAGTWQTSLQVLDTLSGEPAHTLQLDGNFEVETISADGESLFLIEHLPAVNPDHYVIRLYDLSSETLVADPLRSKTSEEFMAGYAWEGLASPGGKWLLTLYLSTARNVAFIHALNLVDKAPICLDLPSGDGNFDALKNYTMALAPDGQMVYAANPTLGVVVEVSLGRNETYGVARQTHFAPAPALPGSEATGAPAVRSLIAPDGRQVYFSLAGQMWAYDTETAEVFGPFGEGSQIVGLGIGGSHLYTARLDGSVTVFDSTAHVPLDFETLAAQ